METELREFKPRNINKGREVVSASGYVSTNGRDVIDEIHQNGRDLTDALYKIGRVEPVVLRALGIDDLADKQKDLEERIETARLEIRFLHGMDSLYVSNLKKKVGC